MKHQKGFSLLELTVVLIVIGTTLFIARSMTPSTTGSASNQAQQANFHRDGPELKTAERLLFGFILSHNRLPCPDTNGDGHENCVTNGNLNQTGFLPYRTMRLPQPALNQYNNELLYGVYRNAQANPQLDMDLAEPVESRHNSFTPTLPPESDGSMPANTTVNALDFCWTLRNAARLGVQQATFPYVGTAIQPLNQAFILVDPGERDADDGGSLFDGRNGTGLGFELPSQVQTTTYDDNVLSIGFYQLAARLQCPAVLARVNGTARAAFAAYDLAELTDFYAELMSHAHNEAIDGIVLTSVQLALATADGLIAAGQLAISVADAIISRGIAIAAAVVSGVAVAVSAVAIGLGIDAEIKAVDGEEAAKADKLLAIATAEELRSEAEDVREDAVNMENRGWLQ